MKLKTPAGLAKAIEVMKKDPEKFHKAFLAVRAKRKAKAQPHDDKAQSHLAGV